MMTATRRVEWDMAHRVPGHLNLCRELHGHRYVAEVTVVLPSGDVEPGTLTPTAGMVEDFGVVRDECRAAFLDAWDHATMLCADDPLVAIFRDVHARGIPGLGRLVVVPGAPTAEYLAARIAGLVQYRLASTGSSLAVSQVRVRETPNCWATWRPA